MGAGRVWLCAALLFCVSLASVAWGQATPTADYVVRFDSTWSSATHPQSFPSNPHFSVLIGATHAASAVFWQTGALASAGMEQMAELGGVSGLQAEFQAEVDAGNADAFFNGVGIFRSPGSDSVSFTAQAAFPELTLVAMLAPSPDWFVGVASLPLLQGGEWLHERVVPLHVYDAGTDSGQSYTSPNADTNPADPISRFDSGLFAPPGEIVGRFTITRTDLPVPVPSGSRPLLPLLIAVGLLAGYALARRTSAPAASA